MIRTLKTIHVKGNLALLGCAVPFAIWGHGWLNACSLVAAGWAVLRLGEALSWKKRIQQIRAALEERVPGAEILDGERPYAEREWGADDSVIHHPFACRLPDGETVRCHAVTEARGLQVLSLQVARSDEPFSKTRKHF